MDLSIIIINYNTKALTTQCIASVYQYTRGLSFEIILVDNNSTETGIEEVQEKWPDIKLLKSQENIGFAGGNNLGIQHARGEYILLLNSDTYLKDNAFLTLLNYIKKDAAIGVVSPRLIFEDGRLQSAAQRFPSIRYKLFEFFRLQKLMPANKSGKILLGSFFKYDQNAEVDWVWGTCFLFPAHVLNKLPAKKLDDTYFMYNEDMQWCMDIKKAGYKIHFCADAEIVHIMGGSNAAKEKLMKENAQLFMRRNYNRLHRGVLKIMNKVIAS